MPDADKIADAQEMNQYLAQNFPVREGWFLYGLFHQHVRNHYQTSWRPVSQSQDGLDDWKVVLCRLEDGVKVEESAGTLGHAFLHANAMAEVEDRDLALRRAPKELDLVDLLSRTAEALASQIGDRKNPRWAIVREARNAVALAGASKDATFEEADPLDRVPSFAQRHATPRLHLSMDPQEGES
jgi:hypothetical protein